MIVACAMSLGFSILAANDEPLAAQSPSKESSPSADEKTDESVPREFLGFAEVSEFRGVIDDPDGYVNLRKEKRADAPVVAKVKAAEPFQFQKKEGEDWCRVKLKSGVSGWMHYSRIKLYFTKDDLPGKSKNGDEIDEQAREQGVNYYDVTQAAYYLDLGTCQLYNRKPRKAIAASLKGLELSPDNAVLIKTNLAHGYLFDNQFEKAKAIYLENKDAKLRDEQQTFSQEVLDDFKQFRDAGITHPNMEKIEALLTSKGETQ